MSTHGKSRGMTKGRPPAGVRENVPLAPLTSLGLGGPARYLADVGDVDELRGALEWADSRGLQVHVLGGGTNVVFPDEGFGGLVLRVATDGLSFEDEGGPTVRVRAGAGVPWDTLVEASVERGLAGLACLSGIPGWTGAAPIQNIGAYGQELADTLISVTCLRRADRERVVLPSAECGFGYRTSRFKTSDRGRFVVLSIELELRREAAPRIAYAELAASLEAAGGLSGLPPARAVLLVRERVLALRRAKSMLLDPDDPDSRSAGSFFLNPVLDPGGYEELVRRYGASGGAGPVPSFPAGGGVKVPAAWLVEHSGFARGDRLGGVGISTAHALALVNRNGTAAELLDLARRIQDSIRDRFGVELEIEPTVVGGTPG